MNFFQRMLDHRGAALGLVIIVAVFGIALFGPLFVADPEAATALAHQPPSADHWFGTTGQGQDVLAQSVVGARMTLAIGFSVGLAVVAIGALIGTTAGYFGGWVDEVASLVINIFLIMPGLPLMVVLAAYLPSGPATIALVLIVTSWAWSARVIRAQALALREQEFIQAAQVSGESAVRIIICEILPNMSSLLVSAFIGATVYAIGSQVALEFLGLGDISQITWGTNLYWASNDLALLTGSWWLFIPTGLGIALVGFALALINSAIDELGNPRLRTKKAFDAALRSHGVLYEGATPVLRATTSQDRKAQS